MEEESTSSVNEQAPIKPDLELITRLVGSVCIPYRNDEIEKAYGVNGYRLQVSQNQNEISKKTIEDISSTSKLNPEALEFKLKDNNVKTYKKEFPEINQQSHNIKNKLFKNNKKTVISKKASRNVAISSIIKQCDQENIEISDMDALSNSLSERINNEFSISDVQNRNYQCQYNYANPQNEANFYENIPEVNSHQHSYDIPPNEANLYENIPEINSHQKVLNWLDKPDQYGKMLLALPVPKVSEPEEYVLKPELHELYNRLKEKNKNRKEQEGNSNTLWDYIKEKNKDNKTTGNENKKSESKNNNKN